MAKDVELIDYVARNKGSFRKGCYTNEYGESYEKSTPLLTDPGETEDALIAAIDSGMETDDIVDHFMSSNFAVTGAKGDTFVEGTWLIEIVPADKAHDKGIYLCKCGNLTRVRKNNVTSGYTKSCGCRKYLQGWV